jgi:ADP-ribose pyrophosphatase YjhB (NUDIX family)
MLQRALDPDDDAAGKWEFPGGHLESGEVPASAAVREWSEEVGLTVPAGAPVAGWVHGHYQGFVLTVPDEFDVSDRDEVANPDGDVFEAVAWWDTTDLVGNPAVRSELAASLDDVLLAVGPVVKGWRDTPAKTPQLAFDLLITDHYTPVVQSALLTLIRSVNVSQVRKADLSGLIGQNLSTDELDAAVRQIMADSYLAGLHASAEQVPGAVIPGGLGTLTVSTDWGGWQPGNPSAALKVADGGLADLLDQAGITVQGIVGTVLDQVGNRIADGLAAGLPSDTIASSLEDIAGSRAEIIAHTEVARAMTSASFSVYAANGVGEWDLITSAGACQVCLDAEAANPHLVSDQSDAPPLHPFCRCSSAPRADSINPNNIQTIDGGSDG